MSVYKRPEAETYSYDFQLGGRRFSGNTEARNKKDADAVERQLRAKARADIEVAKRTGNGPLLLRYATGRYWAEVGERHVNRAATHRDLSRLVEFFGPDKRLDEITDGDVAALVTARRKETTKRNGKLVPISPATINRSTLVLLKALFMRAKRTWRYSFPLEPVWRDHWQTQPEERVRELDSQEADALDAAVRDDYAPWFQFCRLTGLRRNETLIRWSHVNREAGIITRIGKRGRKITTPITADVAAILDACEGHHPEYVFTYIRRQPGKGRGERFPITPAGAKTHWRRLRAKSGVQNFRFHDIRHDVATKLLRETGNLKIVQKALNHANIATTTKYAHVQTDEVAAGLEAVARSRKKSHEKSHAPKLKVV
jgi:integrase